MKRIYKNAGVACVDTGWSVHLDGRAIRTPERHSLCLPTRALAEAIAGEWNDQGEQLDIAGMLLTRLANVAIDRAGASRDGLAGEFVSYCATDLVCHLADSPEDLVAIEESAWGPVRDWAGDALGIGLRATRGIEAIEQPAQALAAAGRYAGSLDDFSLTGLVFGAGLLGSALLAAALREGVWPAEEIFRFSDIDASWQRRRWGEDEEAMQAAGARLQEAKTLAVWFEALKG